MAAISISCIIIHAQPLPAANHLPSYITQLYGKKIGLVVNHTAKVGETHLADTLLSENIMVTRLFSPEHGIRGNVPDGEKIGSSVDTQTGIPLVSLYGTKRKPTSEDLEGLDMVVFDIQDVGVRFYTYISTMTYVMEACAENSIPVMILDRPNPNGWYVDGPVLEETHKSFVGMHPIPIVHGLTVGELAQMINGEGWISTACDLTVIPAQHYAHYNRYSLPVKPSPNLPNDVAINLYPSLALFEGTAISVARGTTYPFQAYGYPDPRLGKFVFTPESIEGMSTNPPLKDRLCYGVDLKEQEETPFTLSFLLDAYQKVGGEGFFNSYFTKLSGTKQLQQQIEAGLPEDEIRLTWQEDLATFKTRRKKYLIYPE